jgi:hypothetical protein
MKTKVTPAPLDVLVAALEWYAGGDDGQRARDALDATGREHQPRQVEYDEKRGRYHCGICGVAVHRVGTGTGWDHIAAIEAVTPAPLDVERLARAMATVYPTFRGAKVLDWDDEFDPARELMMNHAAAIAVAYAEETK